jgi:iron complex outermembrane receptor protein
MKSFLIFVLLLVYLISNAQTNTNRNFSGYSGSLSGKVIDSASGQPIGGASIYIADLKLGALANEAGNYHFANLPSGTYLVEAHAIGHSAQIKNVLYLKKQFWILIWDFSTRKKAQW